MFTRATTYNIIDRTYHGGGAKFNCFLFLFFYVLLRDTEGVCTRPVSGARRRKLANSKGDLSRAADEQDQWDSRYHVVALSLSLVHARERLCFILTYTFVWSISEIRATWIFYWTRCKRILREIPLRCFFKELGSWE